MDIKWVSFDEQLDSLFNDESRQMVYAASYNYDFVSGSITQHTQIPSAYSKYANISRRSSSKFKDLPFYPYGDDNRYPNFLLDLTQKSSLHRTAWNAVANTSYGRGWTFQGDGGAEFLAWAESKGLNSGFTIDTFLQLALFGGAYIKLNFIGPKQISGASVTQRPELYTLLPQKFNEYRVGKEEDSGIYIDQVAYYWHHPEYNSESLKKEYLHGVPRFFSMQDVLDAPRNIVDVTKSSNFFDSAILNQGKYIVPVGRPAATSGYYPSAAYESNSAIDAILVDEALAAFDIAGLKNGLVASHIVTIPVSGLEKIRRSDPDRYDEIIQTHTAKIASELEGAENNKRTLVFVQDVGTKEHKPAPIQIAEIPHTNTSSMQEAIEKRKAATILTAWHVTDSRLIGAPQLAGQGFANQAETLKTSWEIWFGTFIYPRVVVPLQDFVNIVLKEIYTYETGIEIPGVKLTLLRHDLFRGNPSENILREILRLNELRRYYGFDPDPDGDYYLRDYGVNNQFNNVALPQEEPGPIEPAED